MQVAAIVSRALLEDYSHVRRKWNLQNVREHIILEPAVEKLSLDSYMRASCYIFN